jgi:amino acid transporter
MLPEEGGYYRWVDRAFGRFWAFQNGWLTWMYSLVDMAIYPVLFNQYLRYFIPGLDPRTEWLISLAIIWGAAWINVRGSVNVTRVSIIAGCFIMLGFLVLSVASAPRITHIPWQPFASEHAHGLGGLATVGYFVPLLTTLGASDWTTWTEGGWPQIAASAAGSAGRWLAIWIGLGGMISAVALFNALLLGYSRIPFVLADDGLLPKALAKLDVHGTPRTAVIVSAAFYSLFALVAFGKLIVADVLLYSVALFLEFGALIQLRKTEPSLRGVFRIPLGRTGVAVLASLPMIVLVGVIAVSFADGEYGVPAVIGTAIAIAAGPLMYRLAQRRSTG